MKKNLRHSGGDKMDKFRDMDLVIVKNNIKNMLIEELNNSGLMNVKVMSLEEVRGKYYFTYDERAIYYLMKKYGYQVDVARMYLKQITKVSDEDFGNEKIRTIINLRDELRSNNLLIYNNGFKNYLRGKNIVIYNYYDLSKYDLKLINDLEKDNSVRICNDEVIEYNHEVIYQADTIEGEVSFIAGDIVEKINNGIDINKIKICGVSGEYESLIKRIFKWFNIPISINSSVIYSTKIGQDFINNLSNDREAVIEYLNNNYDTSNEVVKSIINRLVKLINKYVWVDKILDVKELIIDEVKNLKVSVERYSNEVSIINNLNEASVDDIVYLIGFNQGEIPKCYKDEDYFNNTLLEKLGLDTTSEINRMEVNKWLFDIKNVKNLIITSKRVSSLGEHYLSSLNDELKLEVRDIELKYNYSNLYNKIKLVSKLDVLVKYNEKDSDLEYLYNNYRDIEYNTYDSSFSGIDKDKLQEYLNKRIVLSYSAMNTYYQCGFRYYLSNILKLNIFEETFYTVLGNLFHYVLSNYFKEGFDLKREYNSFLSKCTYQFDDREKFFLEYLEGELEFIVKTIIKQNETNSLNNILAEERIEIDKSRSGMDVVFKGFVDKIMINDDNSVMSIIDYKTGNPKLNLNNTIYGLDLQLPVYIYLAKRKFSNARVAGFYLQKILNSEIVKDFKHTYEALKEDKLKLQGYSNSNIDVLEKFDSGYYESKVIKGMRTSSKGISSKKILDDVKIDKLVSITEDKIDEAINNIIDAKFDINPKRIGMDNVGCEFCSFKDICFMKEEMLVNLKEYKNMEFLGGEEDDTN